MGKIQLVSKFLKGKSKDVHITINPELWKLFKDYCEEQEGIKPNHKISELILEFLDKKCVLEQYQKSPSSKGST